mmetsp:Transcript_21191/g.23669  ORF Transcript_21191/g.23669 Transcript_21191/m.23669 type:complete len:233 (+) Transcript_21191:74-772(+)
MLEKTQNLSDLFLSHLSVFQKLIKPLTLEDFLFMRPLGDFPPLSLLSFDTPALIFDRNLLSLLCDLDLSLIGLRGMFVFFVVPEFGFFSCFAFASIFFWNAIVSILSFSLCCCALIDFLARASFFAFCSSLRCMRSCFFFSSLASFSRINLTRSSSSSAILAISSRSSFSICLSINFRSSSVKSVFDSFTLFLSIFTDRLFNLFSDAFLSPIRLIFFSETFFDPKLLSEDRF